MQSICPAAKLIEWREDDRAATLCVARPVNAMMAWLHNRPLSRGVTRRWSLGPSYRHDPASDVAQIIEHLERERPCGLVACMLGADGRIVSGLLWRGKTRPPAVVVCACHATLPTCPAAEPPADPIWGIWDNLGELEGQRGPAPLLWGRLFEPRFHP